MYWRRFELSSIPLDDAKEFEKWLKQRWEEKEGLLEYFSQTGHFPTDNDRAVDNINNCIDTEVRLVKWYEIGQIFVVLATFALVVNVVIKFGQIVMMPLLK